MSGHSWTPVDLSALEPVDAARPTLKDGLLYPGQRHLFSGEPEAGKSWLALVIALEEIQRGKHVVWVDLESDKDFMAERLRSLGASKEELRRCVYIRPEERIGAPGVSETIDEILVELAPSAIVFDAFAGLLDLHGLDGNKSADVERGYRTVIEPWRKNGAAAIVIDHVVKSKDARGRFATGSERKLGAVDVHIGLEVVQPFGRGREGRSKVFVHKDRSGFLPRPQFGEFLMVSDEDGVVIASGLSRVVASEDGAVGSDAKAWQPTVLMQRIALYLEANGPASRNRIEKACGTRREYTRMALDALINEGHVSESSGARGARICTFEQPYSPSNDFAPMPGAKSTSDDLAPATSPNGLGRSGAKSGQPPPHDLAPSSRPIRPGEVVGAGDDVLRCRCCQSYMSADVYDGLCLTCAGSEVPAASTEQINNEGRST